MNSRVTTPDMLKFATPILMRDGSPSFAMLAGADDLLPLVTPASRATSLEVRKSRRAITRQNCSLTRFAVLQTLRFGA